VSAAVGLASTNARAGECGLESSAGATGSGPTPRAGASSRIIATTPDRQFDLR